MKISDNKTGIAIVGYFFIALSAFAIIMTGSQWGIGISPDSMRYIEYANYLSGKGGDLSTHYPPIYPSFLALSNQLIDENIYTSSKYAHALLYVLNALLFTAIIYSLTRNYLHTGIFSAIFITSSQIYTLHVYAVSEPLFLLLLFSGMYLLFSRQHLNSIHSILLPAILISISSLTRYAGISAIIATCIFVGLNTYRKKKLNFLVFTATTCTPISVWLIHNAYTTGMIGNRSIETHLISFSHIEKFLQAFSFWFHMPHNSLLALSIISLLAASVVYLHIRNKDQYQNIRRFHQVLAIFIASYIAFIMISISFFDALTPLDFRVLSPVFISLILIAITALQITKEAYGDKSPAYMIGIAMGIALIITQTITFYDTLNSHINNGMGFSSRHWKQSKILPQLERQPHNSTIYTNAPEPIALHTGINATMIPAMISPSSSRPRDSFEQEITEMENTIRSGQGIYVHFFNVDWRWYLPKLDTVIAGMELSPVYEDESGVILQSKQ